ncbi:hypothetical protein XENTR_v10018655 [Xenopus tropicalis]|nr:hypothetical protein XENTR_v10018655 [Xenopus tropicalis]
MVQIPKHIYRCPRWTLKSRCPGWAGLPFSLTSSSSAAFSVRILSDLLSALPDPLQARFLYSDPALEIYFRIPPQKQAPKFGLKHLPAPRVPRELKILGNLRHSSRNKPETTCALCFTFYLWSGCPPPPFCKDQTC